MFWIILYPFLQANSGRLNYLPGTKLLSEGTELPKWKNDLFCMIFFKFLFITVSLGVLSLILPIPSTALCMVIEDFGVKVFHLEDKENPNFAVITTKKNFFPFGVRGSPAR